ELNRRPPGWFVFSEVTLPGSAGSSTHHADEEEVAHNSPLLRRVSDPYSNRPVVGNFQELRADLKRSEATFKPQILRKRQFKILLTDNPNDSITINDGRTGWKPMTFEFIACCLIN
ncbi:MAG: hypothetical protein ACK56K_11250, partial [Akkermansiaceae bacterium]